MKGRMKRDRKKKKKRRMKKWKKKKCMMNKTEVVDMKNIRMKHLINILTLTSSIHSKCVPPTPSVHSWSVLLPTVPFPIS